MNRYNVAKLNKGVKNSKNSKNGKKGKKTGQISAGKIILLSFLSLLFAFFLVIYIFLNVYKPAMGGDYMGEFTPPVLADGWDGENMPGGDGSPNFVDMGNREWGDTFNILLAGKENSGVGNTDTIMVVSFNVKDSRISVLSIPRDTYVSTKQHSAKINDFYPRGYLNGLNDGLDKAKCAERGMKDLGAVIKYMLGIPIDRYILMDLDGFKFLVDKIDGIDMEVPMRMKYDDPDQDLHIDLQPGFQHLDGNKAEQLIRFRKGNYGFPDYVMGDIGRIATQQKFLAAVAKKVMKDKSWKNISAIFEMGEKYMTTNISLGEAGWFAMKALDVKIEDMRVHMLPQIWFGEPINHCEVYRQETMEMINKYYNPYKEDIPASNFNIYDKNIGDGYKPEILIDGKTLDTFIQ